MGRGFLVAGLAALVLGLYGCAPKAAAPETYGYRLTREIAAGDGKYDYVSYHAGLHRLLIGREHGVMAYDLDSGRVTDRLVAGRWIHAVVLTSNARRALATAGDDNSVIAFDPATGAVAATIPVGDEPDGAVFEPATGQVLVMNAGGGDVSVIDPRELKEVDRFPIGPSPEFAVVDGLGHVYVNVSGAAEIAEIDARTRKVTRRIPLPGCTAPTALAWLGAQRMLVSTCANGVALAIAADDGRVLARLPVGGSPDAVIVDKARGRMFIPCGDDARLRVFAIDGDGPPRALASVATRLNARTGGLDPRTGRLYLPRADLDPPDSEDSRAAQPGSFRLLVIDPPTGSSR